MTKIFFCLLGLIIAGFILANCTWKKDNEKLARTHCSSCHLFPNPSLLDKLTWEKNVLPAMGRLLGAQQLDQHPFEESDRMMSRKKFSIPYNDWKKIVEYYVIGSPKEMPQPSRSAVNKFTEQFEVIKDRTMGYGNNTFLKIDTGNKWIYAASSDSVLTVLDKDLNIITRNLTEGIIVDMFYENSLSEERTGIITNIGVMNPNDLMTGSISEFKITKGGHYKGKSIFDSLKRPLQAISSDLNLDGKMDYLICGFGNRQGGFFWMQNLGEGRFDKKMLRPLPGAIKAYIEDINADGLPDIVVLFAQAAEGIYLFLNKGAGRFEEKAVLQFPPVYGSTSFELIDFNNDGEKDILYTCGDNADYSPILKNYHGIYIFINEGKFTFRQQFFFPLNGAYKGLAKDFDRDGDLDIAAISYFPDTKKRPQEAFVYLEQSGAFHFIAHSIKEYNQGHWITMDAGDADGDGDEDIVIGSMLLPNEILKKENSGKKAAILLLRNNAVNINSKIKRSR